MAVEGWITDASDRGATLLSGGKRFGEKGNFFAPTVFADTPAQARLLSEEPFGPVAPLLRFDDLDTVIGQAHSLSMA
jgi:succinate-semialdehyde dehydrogenase/glutarate-semialdehyde dehydrogenase